MLGLSRPALAVIFASLLVLLFVLRSFNDTRYALDLQGFLGPAVSADGQAIGGARGKSAGSCRMSWMRPGFVKLDAFDSSLLGQKYSAHLYREHGWDLSNQPLGSPVLFIPGNAGSFRQVRSFAAAAATTYYLQPQQPNPRYLSRQHPGLDFFTLDFNEEFSAFHGKTLIEQAGFANDIVRSILSMYKRSRQEANSHLPVPSSVLIIGHSMGGVVARKMLRMPNYLNGTINTIISISSPHSIPPLTLDRGMETVYNDINGYWRQSYSADSNGPLQDVLLVSISGGASDTTVSSDTSSLLSLAPASHALTVFTTGTPGVWSPVDHLAILWCDQLRNVITKALLEITDPRNPSQVRPLDERIRLLESHLIKGHGLVPFKSDDTTLNKFRINALPDTRAYHIHSQYSALRLTGANFSDEHPDLYTHIIPLDLDRQQSHLPQEFTLLSNLVANDRLNVLACSGTFQSRLLGECESISAQHSHLLPRSHFTMYPVTAPGPDDEPDPVPVLNYIQVPMTQLSRHDFLAIQVHKPHSHGPSAYQPDPDFLISEFRDPAGSTVTSTISFLRLCWSGFRTRLPKQPSMVTEIKFPSFISSLVAFKLEVIRGSTCGGGGLFAPLMQQQTPMLGESKFHPDIRSAVLYTHFSTAYTPSRKITADEAARRGVVLKFWTDPVTCDGQTGERAFSISIGLDLYETARKIILRYRTALMAIPLGVVSIVLATQLRIYHGSGTFISFGSGLSFVTAHYLLKTLLLVTGLQLIQSATLSNLQTPRPDSRPGRFELLHPSFLVSDLLLGESEVVFVVLEWLIVVVGLGWTGFLYIVLEAVLKLLALTFLTVTRPSGPPRSLKHSSASSSTSKAARNSRGAMLLGLAALTVLLAPYQFTFLVLLGMHLITTLRALIDKLQSKASGVTPGETEGSGRYEYCFTTLFMMVWLAPFAGSTMMVWAKSLLAGWLKPFPSDRNILHVLGFMVWMYAVNRDGHGPGIAAGAKASHRPINLMRSSQMLMVGTSVFSVLFGIRHTYMIFDLFNLVFLCLGLVHWT